MTRTSSNVFLFAKDYQPMMSGWARGAVFQEVRPWAGFKTDDFVKEKSGGGATVVRLEHNPFSYPRVTPKCLKLFTRGPTAYTRR